MLNKYVRTAAVAALAVAAGTIVNAQTVKKTITLKGLPEQIAVDTFKDIIYVAVPNFGAKPYDYLTAIDGRTDKVVANYEIPPYAYAIAVDPILKYVYVGGTSADDNGVDKSVLVGFCETEKLVKHQIAISSTEGDGILGVAVNPVTSTVYVANGSDNEIDVVHGFKVTARIALSGEPFGVSVNPFTNQVYAALLNGSVSVINGANNEITATTVTVPPAPLASSNAGIAVDFLTGNVYTTNAVFADASSVAVLGAAGTQTTNITVGNTPIGIDVDPLTNLVFVANTQDGTVDTINATTNTVTKTLPVSGLFLAANYFTEKVYVGANDGTPTVTVITEK